MSTWKCPKCGATNPAENHFHQKITCAACEESFSKKHINEYAPPTIGSKNETVDLTTKFFIQQQVKIFIVILIGTMVLNFILQPYLVMLLDYLTFKLYGY
jgi:hypothetical protein